MVQEYAPASRGKRGSTCNAAREKDTTRSDTPQVDVGLAVPTPTCGALCMRRVWELWHKAAAPYRSSRALPALQAAAAADAYYGSSKEGRIAMSITAVGKVQMRAALPVRRLMLYKPVTPPATIDAKPRLIPAGLPTVRRLE